MNGSVLNGFRKIPNHVVIKRYLTLGWNMRGKALTLALLLFASALAGCIGEGSEEPDDRTSDDIDVNDVTDVTEQLDLESCEDAGGTWIEVQN